MRRACAVASAISTSGRGQPSSLPRGRSNAPFLRRIALGEFVAPYRILDLVTGVVPMEDGAILTAASADARGYRGLAAWLRDAESEMERAQQQEC